MRTTAQDEAPQWPEWVERWILPYVRIPALFPVLIAIVGHIVVVAALPIIDFCRTPSVASGVASGFLVFLSLRIVWAEISRFRKPGPLTAVVMATWALVGLVTVLALETGFL